MAASITFNTTPTGGQKANTTVTVTVAGATAATAYNITVARDGQTQTIPVKTDGTGAASATFVPQGAGTYTLNLYPAVAASVATATLNTGGHG